MTIQECLDYINSAIFSGMKLGLDNITTLMAKLGNVQDQLRIIHVAGTNGKGSTCAIMNQILLEEGYHVGFFSSPHLVRFQERIRINGVEIVDDVLIDATVRVKAAIDEMLQEGHQHPSHFEIVTAIAFLVFVDQKVDFVVLEVGLGGRLDSTNVCLPIISVITSISKDHMNVLGDNLAQIAREKAGIIKESVPVVLYPQAAEVETVIREVAQQHHAAVIPVQMDGIRIHSKGLDGQEFSVSTKQNVYRNLNLTLLGEHQVFNAVTAITVMETLIHFGQLHLSERSIFDGLRNTRWPGRMERIADHPLVFIDGAHNVDGALALQHIIEDYLKEERIQLIIGMLEDKDVDDVLDILLPYVSGVIATEPDNPRKMSAAMLADKIKMKVDIPVVICEDVYEAMQQAKKADDMVSIYAGSLYMIGDVKKYANEIYENVIV